MRYRTRNTLTLNLADVLSAVSSRVETFSERRRFPPAFTVSHIAAEAGHTPLASPALLSDLASLSHIRGFGFIAGEPAVLRLRIE